jgi:hypothetical protein
MQVAGKPCAILYACFGLALRSCAKTAKAAIGLGAHRLLLLFRISSAGMSLQSEDRE